MEDVAWHWVGSLAVVGLVGLYFIFRLPKHHWPRTMAVTAGGAMVALFFGDASALWPILMTGCILTLGSAATQRK